jgi:acylphosphatase
MQKRNESQKARNSHVHGRVQGVGFRYWARSTATRLGLSGWVRNCDDGSVELFYQGASDFVDQFEQLLEKGPPGASVSRVDSQAVLPRGSYKRFSITV